jgi:uncharacterized protein (TIGR02001 family)
MSLSKPSAGLIAAIVCGWSGSVAAQPIPDTAPPDASPPDSAPASGPSLAFGFGAASDYLFRGVSRTNDRAQAFGSLDAAWGEAYAGVWASNAAFRGPGPARSGAEVDIYGGWRPEFRGYSLDLGVQYDAFAGQPTGADLDYVELYAKVSRAIGPVTGRIGLHYAPDFAGHGGAAWYAEAGADYAITRDWTASAGVGRQTGERPTLVGGGDYLTWCAGLARALGQHVTIAIRYSDTDHHRYGQSWDGRVAGEIRTSF